MFTLRSSLVPYIILLHLFLVSFNLSLSLFYMTLAVLKRKGLFFCLFWWGLEWESGIQDPIYARVSCWVLPLTLKSVLYKSLQVVSLVFSQSWLRLSIFSISHRALLRRSQCIGSVLTSPPTSNINFNALGQEMSIRPLRCEIILFSLYLRTILIQDGWMIHSS